MSSKFESMEKMMRIKLICSQIYTNPRDFDNLKILQGLINDSSSTIIKTLEPIIFSVFFPILKMISEDSSSFKTKEKQQIVDTFKALFDKIKIDKLPLFFNIYGFLLFEIYDHKNHKVLDTSEEYKLSIVECTTSLSKSLDSTLIEKLYVKENAPKLCQMIYTLLDLAKNEQFRKLRISAIECIMALARVLDDEDFNDLVTRNQVAEVFLFFLPGVASQLKHVALIDEKFGHRIPAVSLKAWGRIVTLLMQDYNAFDRQITFTSLLQETKIPCKHKLKDENEIKEYIEQTERSPEWYRETDRKLKQIIVEFTKLTHHSHPNVRLELANLASLLIDNCIQTMPSSISHLIDIIIILSEDSDDKVAARSRKLLESLSSKLTSSEFKSLLDNVEEGFYTALATIPRKFNGIDEKVQIVALNSLIGYLSLFGKHSLSNVLHSTVHLNKLLLTLLHISEFDKTGISTLEEYTTTNLDLDIRVTWKKFRYFKEEIVLNKMEQICHLLAKFGASPIVGDFLLDIIATDSNQKKEAIFLLNEIAAGFDDNTLPNNLNLIKNIISTYTDSNNWYIPLSVMVDEEGYEYTLGDVQNNIVQVCLLVEGIGKIALAADKKFAQFLLKTLYLVLERAGSFHPLVRAAGTLALSNISNACGYSTVTDLINKNIDYFSFHIERKLKKNQIGGLHVLAVVLKYSSREVLNSTCDLIDQLTMEAFDKNRSNLNDYLQVFKMFIKCLRRWLNTAPIAEPFKTKLQKIEEFEPFKVSNIDETIESDFSDDIMGKTAEEMYREDLEKSTSHQSDDEIEGPQEYKKPEPPIYIKLVVAVLTKSSHCLPSKNQARKLLVLEILTNGVPLLKEWEDELLPIVHQIWSPLVDRFKEDDPLIVSYSFQLLTVLARLSKDFIRSRTAKEVLPSILTTLNKLSLESYLKDKGSAYRYSQNYKLQQTILRKLAYVIIDLDMAQVDVDRTVDIVFKYTSDRQPIPLQEAVLDFFSILYKYDPEASVQKLRALLENVSGEYEKNSEKLLSLVRTSE